jgi:aspartyl-tRNA(Asn)/glutamyl-tRNA(Gln) amidotransferase subunit A
VELPPAAGVPIAVKDLFDVAGHETTGCCEAYRGRIALHDAPVIRTIRDAGAVLMGKTNQHELAAGGTNLVSACGRTGNPWDPRRMTGGSSGGSAAAVAAGVVPWAMGSDTGGSIRIPASMCGIFGLKPTTGRLSIEGVLPLAPSLDCPGPMAGTVQDLWLLWRLLGDDQPSLFDADSGGGQGANGGLRIGVPGGPFAELVHPEVLAAVGAVVRDLDSSGVEVREVGDEPRLDAGDPEGVRAVWRVICFSEFAEAHQGIDRGLVAPSVRRWMERGESYDADTRARAAERRAEIDEWFRTRLRDVDALVIPTTPYPAPLADQATVDLGPAGVVDVESVGPGWLTSAANLAGTPAVNLPAARSSEGLPIGVSLVGRHGDEETILRLAARWEAATGYRPRQPSLPA